MPIVQYHLNELIVNYNLKDFFDNLKLLKLLIEAYQGYIQFQVSNYLAFSDFAKIVALLIELEDDRFFNAYQAKSKM